MNKALERTPFKVVGLIDARSGVSQLSVRLKLFESFVPILNPIL